LNVNGGFLLSKWPLGLRKIQNNIVYRLGTWHESGEIEWLLKSNYSIS
jgi:hypothetical protein